MHSSISDEEKRLRKKIRYNSFYQKKNKGNKGKASNVNIRDNINIKEKVDTINKISVSNKKRLESTKKYNLDEIASNIEEQKMKKYFIKNIYNNLNHINNSNNNISKSFSTIKERDESLFNSSSEVDILNKTKSNKINKNDTSISANETIFL